MSKSFKIAMIIVNLLIIFFIVFAFVYEIDPENTKKEISDVIIHEKNGKILYIIDNENNQLYEISNMFDIKIIESSDDNFYISENILTGKILFIPEEYLIKINGR